MCKDIVTTCSAAAPAWSAGVADDHAAAPDSALRDPAPAVKPSGRPRCKNACTCVHGELRKVRNTLADRRAALKNLLAEALCAGPRPLMLRQLTPLAAHAPAADNAALVHAAALAPSRSGDSVGSTATAASAAPLADIFHCNTASANAEAKRAARIPSRGTADADADSPLAADRCAQENDSGPREPFTPDVQVSERSGYFAPRRFSHSIPFADGYSTKCAQSRDPPAAPWARPTARFWAPFNVLLTNYVLQSRQHIAQSEARPCRESTPNPRRL
jgi:hypothetical protein